MPPSLADPLPMSPAAPDLRAQAAAPAADLSTLAWVEGELRRSLEQCIKSLRRWLKESAERGASDVDAVDPAVLRGARAPLHQSAGALELVGQTAAAEILRACEAALQRLAARPAGNAAAVQTIERAAFAVLDYVARRVAGKAVGALAMFPQYAAVQALAGVDRVHPCDLWSRDWHWQALQPDPGVAARGPDDAARAEMEPLVLALMRQPGPEACTRMGTLCAGLAAGAEGRARTLWQLAAALYEGQAGGLIEPDVHVKRLASRLHALLRAAGRGQADWPDRLARELLFFCLRPSLPDDASATPRLAAVQRAWPPDDEVRTDYEQPRLGLVDPARVVQARKRAAAAKEAWSAAAGGETTGGPGVAESMALLAESTQRLFPDGDTLARALMGAAARVTPAEAPAAPLAMEVATSLLYLDAVLDDGELDAPALPDRVRRLAARVQAVTRGAEPAPLEPWMEELYRRVCDRQTMGSVVQELRASMAEAEKQLDTFFRDPSQTAALMPVPAALASMRGVLSVLGIDPATQAVARMREDVDRLVRDGAGDAAEIDSSCQHLAENLGALGFLIDMLGVQPHAAKSLFRFNEASGRLESLVGRGASGPGQDAAPPAHAGIEVQPSTAAASAPPAAGGLADEDAEMREVFLEEAREVIDGARAALAALADAPDDVAELTTVRRGFHTLKGSSRMVGLAEFGDAAWACERLYNTRLAGVAKMDGTLAAFTDEALQRLGEWVDAIASGQPRPESSRGVAAAADALREGRVPEPRVATAAPVGAATADPLAALPAEPPAEPLAEPLAGLPTEALAEPPSLSSMVPDLPSAADLDLSAPLHLAQEPEPAFIGLPDLALDLAPPEPAEPTADAAFATAADDAAAPSVDAVPLDVESLGIELDLAGLDADETPAAMPADAAAEVEVGEISLAEWSDADWQGDAPVAHDAPVAASAGADAFAAGSDAGVQEALEEALEGKLQGAPEETPDEALDQTPDEFVLDLPDESAHEIAGDVVEALAAQAAEGIGREPDDSDEQVKVIGTLRIPIPLFNIFLNEADEQSRRLGTELAEWALEPARPVGAAAIAMAHSLAGNSATVGHAELSALARQLEHALLRSHAVGRARGDETTLFVEAADEIRRLLHQFAAGFLKPVAPELPGRLHEHERWPMPVDALDPFAGERVERDEDGAGMVEAGLGFTAAATPPSDAASGFDALDALEVFDLREASDAPADRDAAPAAEDRAGDEDVGDVDDLIDTELFPIFEEEAEELLPQLHARLADWVRQPADRAAADAAMRTLHTFKGGARLAGAMRLGEIAHRLESGIARLVAIGGAAPAAIERLLARADAMASDFERLRLRPLAVPPVQAVSGLQAVQPAQAADDRIEAVPAADAEVTSAAPESVAPGTAPAETSGDADRGDAAQAAGATADTAGTVPATPATPATPVALAPAADAPSQAAPSAFIDWTRFVEADVAEPAADADAAAAAAAGKGAAAGAATVRVRASLLDRLVGEAGEVSITRVRLEADVKLLNASLQDLTDNLERLRRQLRDLELQAETQMSSRLEAAKAAAEAFDPLELDRFTRFQEITRMMAESVADVATVQRSLQRTLQSSEDELAAQARLTRALQDDLLRTRMVEFDSLADRMYRVVRLAAAEAGKAVRMDLLGGGIEIDRGVLERMVGPFEHLLRNAVAHGIEPAEARRAAGKPDTGSITVTVVQEGNEVAVEVRDDGAGLDLTRIRARAVERGMLAPDAADDDETLAAMIFEPGFSTAESVSGLAGRGVGMDVVRAEVQAMGGRIRTRSEPGHGTAFRLLLPLTTAVTQVVMLRYGRSQVALPSTLVEVVRRAKPAQVDAAYAGGTWDEGGQALPFYWLGALLQDDARAQPGARSPMVIVVRSAAQRVAVHVDEVVGQQEVVVKNLGPQLTRLPGLAGVTLLPSGRVATIYNPVALAAVYGDDARRRMGLAAATADAAVADAGAAGGAARPVQPAAPDAPPVRAPLVMVVDDSLTVRRVTQRLLQREGYRVVLAKDGLDAIDKLAGERPAVLLTDIEMPRMDGFDLVRNVRADARLAALPVIMITSRIAQKHRDLAASLGVDHYLGKPFAEDALLALVAGYVGADIVI